MSSLMGNPALEKSYLFTVNIILMFNMSINALLTATQEIVFNTHFISSFFIRNMHHSGNLFLKNLK